MHSVIHTLIHTVVWGGFPLAAHLWLTRAKNEHRVHRSARGGSADVKQEVLDATRDTLFDTCAKNEGLRFTIKLHLIFVASDLP